MSIAVALGAADRTAVGSVPASPGHLAGVLSPFHTVQEGRAAPGLAFVAMRDARRTLRICHTRGDEASEDLDGDELKGIALHDVEQYEWALIKNNAFHALVAIDADRTLSLISLVPTTHVAPPGPSDPGFATLQFKKTYSQYRYHRNEMPLPVFRQGLRKRGYDVRLQSLRVAGRVANGVCLLLDDTYLLTLHFTSPTSVQATCVGLELHSNGLFALPDNISQGAACATVVADETLACVARLHESGTVTLHRFDTGLCAAAITLPPRDVPYTDLALAPDGSQVCAISGGTTLHVVDITKYLHAHPSQRHTRILLTAESVAGTGVAAARDGTVSMFSQSLDDTVSLGGAKSIRAPESSEEEESSDDEGAPAPAPVVPVPIVSQENPLWSQELAAARLVLSHVEPAQSWFEIAGPIPGPAPVTPYIPDVVPLPGPAAQVRAGTLVEVWILPTGPDGSAGHFGGLFTCTLGTQSSVEGENGGQGAGAGAAAAAVHEINGTNGVSESVGDGVGSATHWCPFSEPIARIGVSDTHVCTLGLRDGVWVAFAHEPSKKALVDRLIKLDRPQLVGRLSTQNGWDNISLNLHHLEAALQYRQLAAIDTMLRVVPPSQIDCALALVSASAQGNWSFGLYSDYASQLLAIALAFCASCLQKGTFSSDVLICIAKRLQEFRLLQRQHSPELGVSGSASGPAPATTSRALSLADLPTTAPEPETAETALFATWAKQPPVKVLQSAISGGRIAQLQAFAARRAAAGTPSPFDGSLRSIKRAAFDLAFHSLRLGKIKEALTLLTNLGENVQFHLHTILTKTTDSALRTLLLESPHTSGYFDQTSARQYCKILYHTHPSTAFSTVLRNVMQENDGKSVESSLLSFNTPLGQLLRTLAPHDATDPLNPLHLCTALKDTERGWSALIDVEAVPAPASTATGYLQAPLEWIESWDADTRARMVIEARALRPLEVAHVRYETPLSAEFAYHVDHCEIAEVIKLFDAQYQTDAAACVAALQSCLGLCHPIVREAVQLHVLAAHALFIQAPSAEGPASTMPSPQRAETPAPTSARLSTESPSSTTTTAPPSAAATTTTAATTPGPVSKQVPQSPGLDATRAPAVSAAAVTSLLARARRLFDVDAFATLGAELREAVHAYVMQDLVSRSLPAMLACYCQTHGVAPPPAPIAWVTQLRALLDITKPDWSPTGFGEVVMTGMNRASLLARNPYLLLASTAYPPPSTDPPAPSPASLVNTPVGWPAADLRRCLQAHEALQWVFGLGGTNSPPLAALQAMATCVPFNTVVHALVQDVTSFTERVTSPLSPKSPLSPGAQLTSTTTPLPRLLTSLSERYSLTDVLDYRHYLRQGRPLAAFNAHGAVEPRPATVTSTIALAVEHFTDNRVLTACLLFFRCLPLAPETLAQHCGMARDYVDATRKIFVHETQMLGIVFTKAQSAQEARRTSSAVVELLAGSSGAAEATALLTRLERAIRKLAPREADPVAGWRLLARLARIHGLPASTPYLEDCARMGQWLQFFLFAQEALVPAPDLVRIIEAHVSSTSLAAHMLLALQRVHPRELATLPVARLYPLLCSSPAPAPLAVATPNDADLTLVLCSLPRGRPGQQWQRDICNAAVTHREPFLAVLASTVGPDKTGCACAWLQAWAARTGQHLEARGRDAPALHAMLLELCSARRPEPMLEAISLFDPSSPLAPLMRLHAAVRNQDWLTAAAELRLYMRGGLATSDSAGRADASAGSIALGPPAWVRRVADDVVAALVAQASSDYERFHILDLLANVKYASKYEQQRDAYRAILACGVSIAAFPTPQVAFEELLTARCYPEARAYAQLHQLDMGVVLTQEATEMLATTRATSLWADAPVRTALWTDINKLFVNHNCPPAVASRFFAALANEPSSSGTGSAQLTLTLVNGHPVAPEASATVSKALSLADKLALLLLAHRWLATPPNPEAQLALRKQIYRLQLLHLAQHDTQDNGEGPSLPDISELDELDESQEAGSGASRTGSNGWGVADETALVITDIEPLGAPDSSELNSVEQGGLARMLDRLLAAGHVHRAAELTRVFHHASTDVMLAQLAVLYATDSVTDRAVAAVASLLPGIDGAEAGAALHRILLAATVGHAFFRRLITNHTVARTLGMGLRNMAAEPAQKVLHFLLQRGESVFDLARDFINANKLEVASVAVTLSALYVSQANRNPADQSWRAWSEDTFAAYARLADTALLGKLLLEEARRSADSVPIDVEVDLILRANSCHVAAGSMDGLGAVIRLVHERIPFFVQQKAFQLLVTLYRGLRQPRRTEEILHALYNNSHFELFLGQKGSQDHSSSLETKLALRDFLLKYHEQDTQQLQMLSVHHSMFRAMGESRLAQATTMLRALGSEPPGPPRHKDLLYVIQLLGEAAQMFGKEDCPRNARHCLLLARLVGLQAQMPEQALLNLRRDVALRFLAEHPNVRESIIVADAYEINSPNSWVAPLYHQVVEHNNDRFLEEFRELMLVPSGLYADVVALYMRDGERTAGKAAQLRKILETHPDRATCHRLAVEAGLTAFADTLIRDAFVAEMVDAAARRAARRPSSTSTTPARAARPVSD
eukprot:m.76655 g.76655  ORF g.76655 m.76655 type:complete len:2578 (+) comp13186_c1_seq3:52-7785(+)